MDFLIPKVGLVMFISQDCCEDGKRYFLLSAEPGTLKIFIMLGVILVRHHQGKGPWEVHQGHLKQDFLTRALCSAVAGSAELSHGPLGAERQKSQNSLFSKEDRRAMRPSVMPCSVVLGSLHASWEGFCP